ncbi:hypothetical protein AB0L06_13290 [Spirillospora sp. NPDC052269]
MTFADTLRDNKVVHTVAGAGDLAVAKLREAPEQVGKARETAAKYQGEVRENLGKYRGEVRENLDRYGGEVRENLGKYRGQVRETVAKYGGQVRENVGQVRENVGKYRGEARENVGKIQEKVEVKDLPGAAVAYVAHVGTRAVGFVDDLAERGKKVVQGAATEVAQGLDAVAEVGAGDQDKDAPKPKAPRTKKTTGE